MKRLSVLLGLSLFAGMAMPASATVLFSQTTSPSLYFPGYISQTAGASGAGISYDDFTLGSTGTFSQIAWSGLQSNSAGLISSFTISIYSDDFTPGTPGTEGTVLYSTTISGNANQAYVGQADQFAAYTFSATIDPFTATADTPYWLSIVATISGSDYYWGSSSGGNDSFLYKDASGINMVGFEGSGVGLAFSLADANAATAPEPSALMLTGTGLLAGVAGLRRRIVRH